MVWLTAAIAGYVDQTVKACLTVIISMKPNCEPGSFIGIGIGFASSAGVPPF